MGRIAQKTGPDLLKAELDEASLVCGMAKPNCWIGRLLVPVFKWAQTAE